MVRLISLEKHPRIMICGRSILAKIFKVDSTRIAYCLALLLAPFVDGAGNLSTKGDSPI